MNTSVLVSVLMSVYNDVEYLNESIESVLGQTYPEFEFIIINDGSTDGSNDILEYYAKQDKRIRLYNQYNMGLTKSLNRGLRLCAGKYVFRQDADDISISNRLETQLLHIQKNDLVLCFSWYDVIDEGGNLICPMVFDDSYKKITKNLNRGRTIYAHGSAVFDREIVLSKGGYPEHVKLGQDLRVWKKICKTTGQVGAVRTNLYQLRLRKCSISKKTRNYRYNHVLHNYLFRDQNRRDLLQNSFFLLRNDRLYFAELLKLLVCLQPINYKWLFKFS